MGILLTQGTSVFIWISGGGNWFPPPQKKKLIDCLLAIIDTEYIYCAEWTGSLNVIQTKVRI